MENGNRIGIVGGGQLGRMMTIDAKRMGFEVTVVDPTPNSPARQVGAEQIIAELKDAEATRELANRSDFLTVEIEHVNTKVLHELVQEGAMVNPSPETLETIKDKLTQKQLLKSAGIQTAEFADVSDKYEILEAANVFGYPFLLKSRHGGYDGRGNAVIKTEEDINFVLKRFAGLPLYAEKFVKFQKELAVMVARSQSGDTIAYPVVETIQKNNICHTVLAPAPIDKKSYEEAQELAVATMKHLNGAGVFGIEMFLTYDGKVLVNEIAPRVHNSGHYTIEACKTPQFKQHILAITGRPLEEIDMSAQAAVMINILGNRQGKAQVKGLQNAQNIPNIAVHIYGKEETKPDRKMGHVTAVAFTLEEALKNAQLARSLISI